MKLSVVVKNALNGDIERVDPAVRRALIAMATEADEQAVNWDTRINGLAEDIKGAVEEVKVEVVGVKSEVKGDVQGLRRMLVGLTTSVIAGIIIGIVNIVISR